MAAERARCERATRPRNRECPGVIRTRDPRIDTLPRHRPAARPVNRLFPARVAWCYSSVVTNRVVLLASMLVAFGCTSVRVQPIDATVALRHVCIEENPKVIVTDFLPVVRDGFDRHHVSTQVYTGDAPPGCDVILAYTALRSWDFAPYLSHAELHL